MTYSLDVVFSCTLTGINMSTSLGTNVVAVEYYIGTGPMSVSFTTEQQPSTCSLSETITVSSTPDASDFVIYHYYYFMIETSDQAKVGTIYSVTVTATAGSGSN